MIYARVAVFFFARAYEHVAVRRDVGSRRVIRYKLGLEQFYKPHFYTAEESEDAALSNGKLRRVAARGREVSKS